MIKANELRKGVIAIDYTGIIREVTGEDIQQQCWFEEGQTGTTEAPLNPIPLTPEWLERCGFKEGKLNDFKIGYDNKDFVHSQMSVPFDGQLIKVKYLHQLQNLYFALTGDELNVKL